MERKFLKAQQSYNSETYGLYFSKSYNNRKPWGHGGHRALQGGRAGPGSSSAVRARVPKTPEGNGRMAPGMWWVGSGHGGPGEPGSSPTVLVGAVDSSEGNGLMAPGMWVGNGHGGPGGAWPLSCSTRHL